MMQSTTKRKSGIPDLPLEVKTMVLREVFRGAVVELANPYLLPHIRRLACTNKTLAVFAIKDLAGEIAEEVLLKEAVFTFPSLWAVVSDDLSSIKSLGLIQRLHMRPEYRDLALTIKALPFFPSLKHLTITLQDQWHDLQDSPNIMSWVSNLRYEASYRYYGGEISLLKLVRLKEAYQVVVELEFWYSPKVEAGSKAIDQQACKVWISDGRIVELDAPQGAEEAWRSALVKVLSLEKD